MVSLPAQRADVLDTMYWTCISANNIVNTYTYLCDIFLINQFYSRVSVEIVPYLLKKNDMVRRTWLSRWNCQFDTYDTVELIQKPKFGQKQYCMGKKQY